MGWHIIDFTKDYKRLRTITYLYDKCNIDNYTKVSIMIYLYLEIENIRYAFYRTYKIWKVINIWVKVIIYSRELK